MPFDPEALAAWRTARGRGGVQELPALPNFPFPLKGDLSGLTELASRADVPNPLIGPAARALDDALRAQRLLTRQATAEQPEPPGHAQAAYAIERAYERYADAVLAAFLIEPPYCRIPDLPPGGCPAGQVCFYDFAAAGVVTDLTTLAIGGYEALATFRDAMGRRAAALPDGAGVSPAPGDDPVSDEPAPPSDVAERGGVSDGPELGLAPGPEGSAGAGAAASTPPAAPRRAQHTRRVA